MYLVDLYTVYTRMNNVTWYTKIHCTPNKKIKKYDLGPLYDPMTSALLLASSLCSHVLLRHSIFATNP